MDNVKNEEQSKKDGIQSIKVDIISKLILDFESKLGTPSDTSKMSISTQ